jgi:hypothetical protein
MTQRSDYHEIDDLEDLALWLVERHGYALAYFGGNIGVGLTMTHGGGCYGALSPGLIAEMREEGWLEGSGPTGLESPHLTPTGLHLLRSIMAGKWTGYAERSGLARQRRREG